MSGLLPYVPRLCRWPVLVAGVGLTWLLTWWRAGDVTNEVGAIWMLRAVVAAGAVAAVFALDDPSAALTRSTVGARKVLMVARLAVVGCVVVVAAFPTLLAVGEHLSGMSAAGVLLESFTLVALLTGVSLTAQRRWQITEPAQFLILCVVMFGVWEQISMGRWSLLSGPGPAWGDSRWRWAALCVLALGLCTVQLRDPAARGLRRVFAGNAPGVASQRERASS
ncbi:MAG: hypothetical protein ABI720_02960 [Actinomycetes bacterium]